MAEDTAAAAADTVREAEPAAPALAPDAPIPTMPQAIALAIVTVMGKIDRLEKNETNPHGNYRYASVDDFYDLVRPLMAEAGLIILPLELATSFRTAQTGDKSRTWLVVKYGFLMTHQDGTQWGHMPVRTIMADASMGSQAFGAAASYADKFFLRALFRIATGDVEVDGQPAGPLADPVTSRQAQGMGRDQNARTQQRQPPAQTQQRRADPGTKSSAQAKRDGDWEKLTKGMRLQRNEDELNAWAASHEGDLAKLPRVWKIQVREEFVKYRDELRDAAREADRMDTNRSAEDQEADDDGMGFDGEPAADDGRFPGDRPAGDAVNDLRTGRA